MGEEANYTEGIALIVEGATEKVFYSELIRLRALVHGATVERASDGDGTNFSVTRQDGSSELVKINNVGTVTQMTNSAEWFLRACGRCALDCVARLWYKEIGDPKRMASKCRGLFPRLFSYLSVRPPLTWQATSPLDASGQAFLGLPMTCCLSTAS